MRRIFLLITLMLTAFGSLNAQNEVIIGNTTTSDNGQYLPTDVYYEYSYTQQIYLQSEIGTAMNISKIAFQYFYSTSYTRNIDIYIGHTTKSSFSSISDYVYASAMTLVYSGNVTFVNTGTNYWCEITLTTPFAYNGTDNLVVAVDDNSGISGVSNQYSQLFRTNYNMYSKRSLYANNAYNNINPSGSYIGFTGTADYRNNIKLISSCSCCPPNLAISNVTSNSATITWSVATGNTATVEYHIVGDDNYTTITESSPYNLEGLLHATTYEVRARTNCSDATSDYATEQFTTMSVQLATIYVKPSGEGDGSTWANAMGDVNQAISLAQLITQDYGTYPEIWVAGGTYTGDTESDNAFVLSAGTKLYGGFAGNESNLTDRDPSAHETILSGANARRVIYFNTEYNYNQAIIDGFTIANGNAVSTNMGGYCGGVYFGNNGLIILQNCVVKNNNAVNGGGMYLEDFNAYVMSCEISSNTAEQGGGVSISNGTYLYNSLIYNNTATQNAGGVFFQYGIVYNCDIVNNTCNNAGGTGGIGGYGSKGGGSGVGGNVVNSVVWGNKSNGVSSQIDPSNYNLQLSYSAVEGGFSGTSIINLSSENDDRGASCPKFNNPASGDFTLKDGSILIGRGFYDEYSMPQNFPAKDLAGNDRVRHGGIDVGAYESDYEMSTLIVPTDGIVYVKSDGTGNGSSWANATSDLALALNECSYLDAKPQIWVAAGTYYGNFAMKEGINVYGGFNGTENDLTLRNPSTNVTILDAESSGRVLSQDDYFETATTWDGFTIQHGSLEYGQGAGAYIQEGGQLLNCKIINNICNSDYGQGGGVCVQYGGNVQNCRIEDNQAAYGGGCVNYGGSPMINCVIVGNTATVDAGGAQSGSYLNCTFADNMVNNSTGTGGVCNADFITNSIIWGNRNTAGLSEYSYITATYSCIEGGCSGIGNYNISSENTGLGYVPKFVDPENGDWNLQDGSICVNRGNNSASNLPAKDILGNDRIRNGIVDCGAYETPYNIATLVVPGTENIVYVKQDGTGNGSSWANAAGDLAFVLTECASLNPAPTVWVAEMTINGPVKMQPGINVYGGFAGTEETLAERNLADHHTIINGNYSGRCLYQEMSFTPETRAVWDGFVIQNGYSESGAGVFIVGYADLANCEIKNCNAYASGYSDYASGGGVYASNSTLTSCYIHNNSAQNPYTLSYYERGTGGGVFATENVVLKNCIIANNTASGQGSGAYFIMIGNKMINCDVVNCYSMMYNGFAVDFIQSDYNYLYNSVLWGNKAQGNIVSVEGSVKSHCASDVELDGTLNVLLDADNGGGSGPMFTTSSSGVGADYDCSSANWMPLEGSALINIGDNNVDGLPEKDFAGSERIQNTIVDAGAYETPYNALIITPGADGIIYVKQTASGSENGSSWENATSNLTKAVSAAAGQGTRTKVWVAEGTYNGTFNIKARTNVYGGFAGTETTLSERQWRDHLTILHGDGENTTLYQTTDFANVNDTAVWDGFVIENGGGSAEGGGAKLLTYSTLRNCIIRNNSSSMIGSAAFLNNATIENCEIYSNSNTGYDGGTVYMNYYCKARNCKVYNNTAENYGGFYLNYGNELYNCLIANNTAANYAGIMVSGNENKITSCTVAENLATSNCGGICMGGSTNVMTNTVVWGNKLNSEDSNFVQYGDNSIAYCALPTDVSGYNNIVIDASNIGGMGPKFVNPVGTAGVNANVGDYSLQQGSYLINKGTSEVEIWNPDLAGNARVQHGKIDLGAYESSYTYESPIVPSSSNIIFVKNGGTGNGSSWENATSSLQLAVNEAFFLDNKPTIWVKGDTFTGSFKMKEGVDVYGGFAGNETSLDDRNLADHTTILDGNAAGRVLKQESDFTEETVWDGFTIKNGKLETTEAGSGAYLLLNGKLRNCDIKNNYSTAQEYSDSGVRGGAVAMNGATLENCKIHDNSLTTNAGNVIFGAGVYVVNGTLKNCEIYKNTLNNSSSQTNAYCAGIYSENSRIENSIIRNNTSSGYSAGVGLYGNIGNTIINSIVANNTAAYHSGIRIDYDANNVNIINCDIVCNKNTSGSEGAGLMSVSGYSNNKLINSVLWGNKYGSTNSEFYDIYEGILTVTNSAVAGMTVSGNNNIQLSYGNTGSGNVPSFTQPATGAGASYYDGVWTLEEGSSLVNAGTQDGIEVLDHDLAGNVRVDGDNIDIGAYERSVTPPLIPDGNNRFYVRATAFGLANGSSWENATNDLQLAVDEAVKLDPMPTIWVAEGTYTGSDVTQYAYYMKGGVNVYGGFAGTEANLADRDFRTHVTTLDGGGARGVLCQTDDFTEDTQAVWDGFTIQNGNGALDGVGAHLLKYSTLRNCIVKNNVSTKTSSALGAGIYANYSTVDSCEIFSNSYSNNGYSLRGGGVFIEYGNMNGCQIHNNSLYGNGGGVYSRYSTITNCQIINNISTNGNGGGVYSEYQNTYNNCLIANNTVSWSYGQGGGVYVSSSETELIGCDVVYNLITSTSNSYNGGGVYSSLNDVTLTNCVVWGNKKNDAANNIGYSSNAPTVTYCAVEDGFNGVGNISLSSANDGTGMKNPKFTTLPTAVGAEGTGGNWALLEGSALINKGITAGLTLPEKDLAGNDRVQNGKIDIGAYESAFNAAYEIIATDGIIYVTQEGAGLRNGSSWENATPYLSIASVEAATISPRPVIWVKAGTYQGDPAEQYAFQMVEGVNVYGGFAGNETTLAARNVTANVTILDGQNTQRVLLQNNAFTDTTVWDGFTIQNGAGAYEGAGAYLNDKGVLRNCVIANNSSTSQYGGGVYLNHGTLERCKIHDNTLTYNASGYTYGGGVYSDYGVVRDCEIYGNSVSNTYSQSSAYGGGLAIRNTAVAEKCHVHGNTSGYYGGGIYAYGENTTSRAIVRNCRIENNNASSGGGAYSYGYATFIGCNIANNTTSGSGGGVSASYYNDFVNCNIVNNLINNSGSGAGI